MFPLTQKPDMGARLYEGLIALASDPQRGTDFVKVVQYLAGVLVETCMVFDRPDLALHAGLKRLSLLLECDIAKAPWLPGMLPPAHIIDFETERGRAAARTFFEEWMDCAFDFHSLLIVILHNIIMAWHEDGQPREDSLKLLAEFSQRCMAFEIAAQELCDVVIEEKSRARVGLSRIALPRSALWRGGASPCRSAPKAVPFSGARTFRRRLTRLCMS